VSRFGDAVFATCLVAVCALAAPAELLAQGPANLRVLAIPPDRPMLCRHAEDADSLPRGVVAREFRFSDDASAGPIVWTRTITVFFDSAGKTLTLLDQASLGLQGGESVLSVTMPGRPAVETRTEVRVDSVAVAAAKAKGDLSAALAAIGPHVSRSLAPDESKKVAQLGSWLWERKCP
jgi:hypothetical protein